MEGRDSGKIRSTVLTFACRDQEKQLNFQNSPSPNREFNHGPHEYGTEVAST